MNALFIIGLILVAIPVINSVATMYLLLVVYIAQKCGFDRFEKHFNFMMLLSLLTGLFILLGIPLLFISLQ